MDVQMKCATFKPSDPISVLSFPHRFKRACDSNPIHEGAAMWLVPHFKNKSAKVTLLHRVCAAEGEDSQQEVRLMTYC